MTFQLTAELEDQILQAMENQEQKFLVDAGKTLLVPFDSAADDEENFYSLPEWQSEDGFSLRESFVRDLKSPFAQKDLRNVLHSGRGVFKGFKSVLKGYPQVEKMWHKYKYAHMHEYIGGWYNQLREIWGLERLEVEIENLDDLIDDDFVFQDFKSSDGKKILDEFLTAAAGEICNDDSQIHEALVQIISQRFSEGCSKGQTGILCRTLSDEFAGCVTAMPVSKECEENLVVTSLFVAPEYRGLGIGTRLLQQYRKALKKLGKKRILLTYSMMPEILEPFLLSSGFRKCGSGFFSEIL